jgi:thiol-disulfide isomerase/thioredoxin
MNRPVFGLLFSVALAAASFIGCGDDASSSAAPADPGFAAEGEGCGLTSDCIGDLECGESGLCAVAQIEQEPVEEPPVTTNVIHEDCAFDGDLVGKVVGDHVKNFSLKTVYDTEYNLHSENCGQPGRKAIYLLLGTGWCGACETYAKRAEVLYQDYKDAGLEILWIESEDQNYEPVTLEWLTEWQNEKGTTFPLTRDLGFNYTYGAMAHASTSLPHLYIIDAETMELVYAEGGGSKWDEAEGVVADLLGVDMPLYQQ